MAGDCPAALSLIAYGKKLAAKGAIDFLASNQAADGSVGVRQNEPEPQWPTSLAVLAWQAFDKHAQAANIDRAMHWILEAKGEAMAQTSDNGSVTSEADATEPSTPTRRRAPRRQLEPAPAEVPA